MNPEAEAVERKETNCELLNQSEAAKLKYKTTKWQAVIQYAGIKGFTEQRSIKEILKLMNAYPQILIKEQYFAISIPSQSLIAQS